MNTFRRLLSENNMSGMVAGTWGFLAGGAVTLVAGALVAYWLGANEVVVWWVCGSIAVFTMVGSAVLLGLEWVNPSVTSPRDFLKIVVFATKCALAMPLVVPAILVLLLTWRWVLYGFVYGYLIPRHLLSNLNLRSLALGWQAGRIA